jgi:uncharacterized protein (DUF362 family)
MVRVALVKGNTRYETVKKALELIKEDVEKDVKGKNRILVKPNLVSTYRQLASVHIDTIRAILDFIKKFTNQRIIIAEGSAGDTFTAYKNFRYMELLKNYNIKLIDLNEDDYEEIDVFDSNFKPMTLRVAKTVLNSDYIISSALLKTHDTVIVTLSIKNMVVGSLINGDKPRIHQGYKAINLNIFKLARYVWPNLAIIDGFTAMEGDGPISGEGVDMRVTIASKDALAADVIGSYIMGFNPDEVGYLYYAKLKGFGEGNLEKIEILGEDINKIRRRFKPHSTYNLQRNWKIEEYLLTKLLK